MKNEAEIVSFKDIEYQIKELKEIKSKISKEINNLNSARNTCTKEELKRLKVLSRDIESLLGDKTNTKGQEII